MSGTETVHTIFSLILLAAVIAGAFRLKRALKRYGSKPCADRTQKPL